MEAELGKSPVITDGDLTIAESGAIIEYLVERYGDGCFAPARELPAYLRYRYWLHYAEGSLMSPLLLKLVFDKIEPRKAVGCSRVCRARRVQQGETRTRAFAR